MRYNTLQTNGPTHTVMLWGCTRVHFRTMHTKRPRDTPSSLTGIRQSVASSKPCVGRRSFKLWYNYTLKASLRRYSSLAISSATQPGISGMATWMMYFRRIAKCCEPRDHKGTGSTHSYNQGTITFCIFDLTSEQTAQLIHIPKTPVRVLCSIMD